MARKPQIVGNKPMYRSQKTGVRIDFVPPLVSMAGSLIPLRETNVEQAIKLSNICPTCHVGLSMQYTCPNHGGFTNHSCSKAKDVGGTMVVLDPDELAAAKNPATHGLAPNILDLAIHKADEVAWYTHPDPGGVAYVFHPTSDQRMFVALRAVIERRADLAFMGRMNLRNAEKIMQVIVGLNGQLIVRELIPPSDMRLFPEIDLPVEQKHVELISELLDQQVTPFDRDSYRPLTRAGVEAFIAESYKAQTQPKGKSKRVTKAKATAATQVPDDMTAQLAAALAAVKK